MRDLRALAGEPPAAPEILSGPPDNQATLAGLRDELVRLGPWHIEVEITPEITTRAFLEADSDLVSGFEGTSFVSPREHFVRMIRRVFPDGLENRSVLDCACNCGAYLFWAKELGAGRCVGLDVREHWINQARFLAAHRTGPGRDVRFEVCDLYDLPKLGLDSFDVTIFNGIFYHLPDPVTGLKLVADLTNELLVLNTAVKPAFPDGALVVSSESRSHAMSGVYGLNWFPTGPQVLARVLRWVGLSQIRRNRWRTPAHQPERLDRIEMLAARRPGAFDAFDAARRSSPDALREVVETSVPPGSTVLVAGDASWPLELDSRTAVSFPRNADEPGSGDSDAMLAELDEHRSLGAAYLAIPAAERSVPGALADLARRLDERHEVVARDEVCTIFAL